MMLHTSGRGMGVAENQDYIRRTLDRYPRLRIILAHMGRYLEAEEFFRFADSGLLEHPQLYLEMSSASRRDVYERALAVEPLRERLIVGSDAAFGCLTGVEAWSAETGPVFITRDTYAWSDEKVDRRFAAERNALTYNVYHVIAAFREALNAVVRDPAPAGTLKRQVFCENEAGMVGAGGA